MISHTWGFLDELDEDGEGRKEYTTAPQKIEVVSGNCVQWHKSLLLFD